MRAVMTRSALVFNEPIYRKNKPSKTGLTKNFTNVACLYCRFTVYNRRIGKKRIPKNKVKRRSFQDKVGFMCPSPFVFFAPSGYRSSSCNTFLSNVELTRSGWLFPSSHLEIVWLVTNTLSATCCSVRCNAYLFCFNCVEISIMTSFTSN